MDKKFFDTLLSCFLFIIIFSSIPLYGFTQLQQLNVNFCTISFDSQWRFYKGNAEGAHLPHFNDSEWRMLQVPHDWSIEDMPNQSDTVKGPFSKNSPGATSTGYTVGGTAWYRKNFILPVVTQDKVVSILFDGVYMNCDVWINGHHLGNHPYGYTAFSFDLTRHLNPAGKKNTIVVRVRNEGKNSRWYSGSGIYRHVQLSVSEPLHVPLWGVYITTPQVTKNKAAVQVVTTISNRRNKSETFNLQTTLIDEKGKSVGRSLSNKSINGNDSASITQMLQISDPGLWSPETPVLYKAKTVIIQNGKAIDSTVTPFGVRSIQFDAVKGFQLNGEQVKLRGGCVHHDNGPLGAAAIDRAEERKVELIKSNGYNAVRTSHNPPSQSFLDACDRLGLIVINEAFDMWEIAKNPQDYHLFFKGWWQKDIQSMVLRDRNHPSVIMWSIGNEIRERADPRGLQITKQLRDEVCRLDATRAITEAICGFWEGGGNRPWDDSAPAFALLDVGGYNYEWKRYEPDHQKHPNRIMVGSESFPKEAFENWKMVEKHPWIIGDFVWTAMDYMGETAIGHSVLDNEKDAPLLEWPWYNAYCGDIDLIGNKKPQSYYRDVVWRRKKIAMAVHAPIPEGRTEKVSKWGWPNEWQSWTWAGHEGKPLQVSVYTRYPIVRLELNGRIIGEKQVSETTNLTATFDVPYAAGTLKAIGFEDGIVKDSFLLHTTGKPNKIRLVADRSIIKANANDLCYVMVEVTDEKGNVVPDAIIPVNFDISGDGVLAGAGNGSPIDMRSFQLPNCTTFRGKCLLIVRPNDTKGSIKIKAQAENLAESEIVVQTH